MRKFESGATRDDDKSKLDFEGFFSPSVLNRYAEYMNKHRKQADGKLRDSDNWQKGIPLAVYMKSGYRHFFDWWANHRNVTSVVKDDVEESLCALLFNTMGYLHEYLNLNDYQNLKPQLGDLVFIDLRSETSEVVKTAVKWNYNVGIIIEVCENDDVERYITSVGGKSFNFYSDELTVLRRDGGVITGRITSDTSNVAEVDGPVVDEFRSGDIVGIWPRERIHAVYLDRIKKARYSGEVVEKLDEKLYRVNLAFHVDVNLFSDELTLLKKADRKGD